RPRRGRRDAHPGARRSGQDRRAGAGPEGAGRRAGRERQAERAGHPGRVPRKDLAGHPVPGGRAPVPAGVRGLSPAAPGRRLSGAHGAPYPGGGLMQQYLQEVGALTMRWVRRLSREKFSMLFTLAQPMVFWLIFFGNLFQRTANTQVVQAPSYIAFLAAGVVVMTILNNGLAGGTDLLFDKENGFLERLMSTPISRTSVVISRFLFVMTITSMQ